MPWIVRYQGFPVRLQNQGDVKRCLHVPEADATRFPNPEAALGETDLFNLDRFEVELCRVFSSGDSVRAAPLAPENKEMNE